MRARSEPLRAPQPAPRRTSRPRGAARRATDRVGADAAVRERLLAAALRAFADQGYDGASISTIAKEVGVTQPLVHYYFRSKEELWRAAVDGIFAEAHTVLLGLGTELRDLDGPATLKVVLRRFVRFSAEHPEVARLMAREGALPGPRLKWLVKRHLRTLFAPLEDLLRAGMRQGWARPFPLEHLMFFLVGGGAHLSLASALARELWGVEPTAPATIEAQSDAFVDFVLGGLGAPQV